MTDTIISLETVNPIEFFGVNNGKLDILKKKFPLLKILSRGTQLKLSGNLAVRIDKDVLKKIFAVILLYTAFKMLDWDTVVMRWIKNIF